MSQTKFEFLDGINKQKMGQIEQSNGAEVQSFSKACHKQLFKWLTEWINAEVEKL